MSTWIAQGQLALVNALIVFVVTFVPVVAWQYRRYGRPNAARLLGAFGLASYTTALLTYTWLPARPRHPRLHAGADPAGGAGRVRRRHRPRS